MEIRHLEHDAIDLKRWDEAIASSPQSRTYAESWYLDLVAPGWSALIGGDYQAVFPLTGRRKYGIRYLAQPPFCQQLGLFSAAEPSLIDTDAFLEAIPSQFKLIEIQLNAGNRCTHPAFRLRNRPNLELRLQPPYGILLQAYSENTRRNIRKATAAGIRVEPAGDLRPIVSLFRAQRGQAIATLRAGDYDTLLRVADYALANDKGFIRTVRDQSGDCIAGAFFLRSADRLIFLFSATDGAARKSGAMPALIDSVIRENAGRNLRLDFEGSADPNLAQFYRGFGSEETVYLQIRRNRLPFPLRLLKP
jgi:hypothetical protein